MKQIFVLVAFDLLALTTAAWPQPPVISGLVNAASYQPTNPAEGYVVTIFGANLAATPVTAKSVQLPMQLGGTSVTVGGTAAPLFYVSPTQINLQVPSNAGGSFVVTTSAGSSSPYDPSTTTPDAWAAGGIFTDNGSGCGQGAILNDATNGSVSVNSAANSASPGDYISIFGTGLGAFDTPIGSPAPASPPIMGASGGIAWNLGAPTYSSPQVAWSGLAPGLVGVDQINAQIPANTREGCAVPVQIAYSEATTPPVTIAIRNGGGQCVDPPSAGYGQITWQKTVSTTSSNVASETDSMTAVLEASPGQQAPSVPTYTEGCDQPDGSLGNVCATSLPSVVISSGPACAVPGYRTLGAGVMTIQGPGLPPTQAPLLPYQLGQLGGISAYQATLPAGSVQAGNFTAAAGGGSDVGAFQSSLQIGADIQIQTALTGVDAFQSCKPLVINWTGGDPKSWVTVSFVGGGGPSASGDVQSIMWAYQTRTSNGTMSILMPVGNATCTTHPTGVTIRVEVDPDPSEVSVFAASGLSLGGTATWRYVYNFQATMEVP